MARIVAAMSGGVDSSVAAALLKEEGHEVIGIMLRLWSEPGVIEDDGVERVVQNKCCSLEAVDDARRVARMLDIPFYLVNVEQEFKNTVVDMFYEAYVAGRTPNPCLTCNRHIRFTVLLNRALALDADYLATGHYVRVDDHPIAGKAESQEICFVAQNDYRGFINRYASALAPNARVEQEPAAAGVGAAAAMS